jgi:hypothetical protein
MFHEVHHCTSIWLGNYFKAELTLLQEDFDVLIEALQDTLGAPVPAPTLILQSPGLG